jgi:hypothetical protein
MPTWRIACSVVLGIAVAGCGSSGPEKPETVDLTHMAEVATARHAVETWALDPASVGGVPDVSVTDATCRRGDLHQPRVQSFSCRASTVMAMEGHYDPISWTVVCDADGAGASRGRCEDQRTVTGRADDARAAAAHEAAVQRSEVPAE